MAADPAHHVPELNDPAVEAAFQAVPPEQRAEILDGELHVQHRPASRHARSSARLGAMLVNPFDLGEGGPGGWVILIEPELHLGRRPDKLAPDLAGWRRDRLPSLFEEGEDPPNFKDAPDWICEVISASTERIDRTKKMRIYRREGVGHLWLVSPAVKTLEVYRLNEARWVLLDTYEGEDLVRAEPFEAMELRVGRLWEK